MHLGFQFIGEKDPTRFTRDKISHADITRRVDRLLKDVVGAPNIGGTFRAGKRPREINPENYQSTPPLPKVVPGAQADSSPSGGGGNDGSRTLSAQHGGADGKPQVSSPVSWKRKASSTGDDERPSSLPEKRTCGSAASPAASASPGLGAALRLTLFRRRKNRVS